MAHRHYWPWMTLNGRNAPLAEINKHSGAHQKNFNEDRPILPAATYRPVIEAQLLQRDSASATHIFLGSLNDHALH